MKIARPPSGFDISLSKTVIALLDSEHKKNPEFLRYWQDIIERLKFTAHREGQAEERLGPGARLWAVADQGISGRPRLVIGYKVVGNLVSIKLLRIG